MRPKFIAAIYFEGRILCFEEYGDVYEFSPMVMEWRILARAPWPERDYLPHLAVGGKS